MSPSSASPPIPATWTFLTNHTHVLVCLTRQPNTTLREVAGQVGITERAVQRIVSDLQNAGVLHAERTGRRNRYTVDGQQPLRHPLEAHRSVHDLLSLLTGDRPPNST